MTKYLSYDVDITVGEIYGSNLDTLLKDLVASSMGKNDGKKPMCFLKSFMFSAAINTANLCSIVTSE